MDMSSGIPYSNHGDIITSTNGTGFTPSTLILMGIPGLEAYHIWFAPLYCFIYITTVLGNSTLLLVIKTVMSLHKPMYLIISQLAFCDLALTSCILPKMLEIFWFDDGVISFSACLIQAFFLQCFQILESSSLSAMAFDRYIAVCHPLRYSAILTNSLIAKIAVASILKAISLVTPLPLLIFRLPFCSRYVAHSYCVNMAVAKLVCSDITVTSVYGLALSLLIGPVDMFCIALSYTLIIRAVLQLPQKKDRFKAFSTCGSHICVMSGFYIPFFFSIALYRLQHSVPLYVHIFTAHTFLLFSPLMNPFIYGVTMKEVRQGMYQVLQKIRLSLECV